MLRWSVALTTSACRCGEDADATGHWQGFPWACWEPSSDCSSRRVCVIVSFFVTPLRMMSPIQITDLEGCIEVGWNCFHIQPIFRDDIVIFAQVLPRRCC